MPKSVLGLGLGVLKFIGDMEWYLYTIKQNGRIIRQKLNHSDIVSMIVYLYLQYGDTALHTAARYGHAGVTRILISARCQLNEQNKVVL